MPRSELHIRTAVCLTHVGRGGIEDVFCPGLCTLTGRVDPEEAATEMAHAYARSVEAQS